jgi:hypothetical protein
MSYLRFGVLLAQAKANQPKPGDWSFGWLSVGLIAAVAVGIVLTIWLVKVWLGQRSRRSSHSPWQLFQDLCTAHHLTATEKHLARQLAKELRLEQPAVLFIEPSWWENERLPLGLTRHLSVLDKLRKRLFAPR